MMKYRVHDVAKDLNVPNKDVIDTLEKYTGKTNKYMAALSEDELDLVFESFTQKNRSENLNEYFAQAAKQQPVIVAERPDVAISPEKPAQKHAEKPAAKPAANAAPQAAAAAAPAVRTPARPAAAAPGQNRRQPGRSFNRQQQAGSPPARRDGRPAPQQQGQKPQKAQQQPVHKRPQQQTVRMENSAPVSRPAGRIVDTHASNVELDRYNEKYDRLASEKVKVPDSAVKKQKLTQRSTRYRGRPRSARRETESERLRRIALERKAKPITVQIPEQITVGELALRLKATAAEVIKKLMGLGVFATVNDVIDFDTASLAAMEFHAKVQKEVVVTIEERIIDDSEDQDDNLVPRAPVVVVMGHVDHGKTSLLDAIRHTDVISTEAGGITQHIGAYQVKVGGRDVTVLDTPGHEAFTTMRARGAQVTDIAILVVAADDGIMPQTVEAINHAKAAEVSIIVAINKMDKPGANPQMVMEGLTKYGLVPEEWGGDVPCVPVSAVTKQGIKDLLETVLLVADMKELKANPDRAAKGTVIEARLDKGRGPVATVLVQNGTLRNGDILVAGTTVGRVRAMADENGNTIDSAGPSVPVEITGLGDVPTGGDVFNAVTDERLARELVEQRRT